MEVQQVELKSHARREGVTVLHAGGVTIQKVRSVDEWKAMNINFKSLKPAVLKGEKIMVLPLPGQF